MGRKAFRKIMSTMFEYLNEHEVLFLDWIFLRRVCVLPGKPASHLVVCGSERPKKVTCEMMTKHAFSFPKNMHVCYNVIK